MAHWRRDNEFLDLMSRFCSNNDKYGREIVPPLPLAFDRVNEGRAPSSRAPLFGLPFEILGRILGYLPDNSLASLAFVNADCRQLARSRQFASILLDYSDASLSLVKKLVEEARERRDNGNNFTLNPSLGACIRRITVATDREWLHRRHSVWLETTRELELTESKEPLEGARHAFFELYIPSIQVVLCGSLPHLELLDWKDRICLRSSMFRALACSTVQHLKLSHLKIDQGLESIWSLAPGAHEWPLRSLYLEFFCKASLFERAEISRFCANILILCSVTLESVVLKLPIRTFGPQEGPRWFDLQAPSFPSLRHLQLEKVLFQDPSVLDALIPAGADCHLCTLEIDTEMDEVHSRFFDNRGYVQSLETFIWTSFVLTDKQSLNFLLANPQILKFALPIGASPLFLEGQLLPLISRSLKQLSSLHLSWYAHSISESALELIGTLASLQQIHLSAGDKSDLGPEWLVDHALLRTHLSTLPRLKRIALSQDTYLPDYDWMLASSYYTNQNWTFRPRDAEEEAWAAWVNSRDSDEPGYEQELTRREVAWETVHRKRMLAEATAYTRSMPRLEWLYFGQIPMKVELSRDPVAIVPLSTARDDCTALLSRMFGRDALLG